MASLAAELLLGDADDVDDVAGTIGDAADIAAESWAATLKLTGVRVSYDPVRWIASHVLHIGDVVRGPPDHRKHRFQLLESTLAWRIRPHVTGCGPPAASLTAIRPRSAASFHNTRPA